MIKKTVKKYLSIYRFRKTNNIKSYELIALNANIKNSILGKNVLIAKNADVYNSKIGYLSSIGRYAKITHTEIGKFCAISWDVTINAISHPYNHLSISAFAYVPYVGNFVEERVQSYQKVIIKNDVWVGANSVVMPGVTIGNGAIIGAGAVVTKDVPDYAIVAGVPAKVIKYRFDNETIDNLLKLKWWDLAPEVIKDNIYLWQGKLDKKILKRLQDICK